MKLKAFLMILIFSFHQKMIFASDDFLNQSVQINWSYFPVGNSGSLPPRATMSFTFEKHIQVVPDSLVISWRQMAKRYLPEKLWKEFERATPGDSASKVATMLSGIFTEDFYTYSSYCPTKKLIEIGKVTSKNHDFITSLINLESKNEKVTRTFKLKNSYDYNLNYELVALAIQVKVGKKEIWFLNNLFVKLEDGSTVWPHESNFE